MLKNNSEVIKKQTPLFIDVIPEINAISIYKERKLT